MSDDTEPRVLPFAGADDDAALVERLRASYAAVPPASADTVARVASHALHAAAALDAGAPTPRTAGAFSLRRRWWWGAAAAAVLVVSVARPWRLGDDPRHADEVFSTPSIGANDSSLPAAAGAPVGTTHAESGAVTFEIRLPASAEEVAIVGDFNGWDEHATPMVRDGAGWSARVPLPPGRHVYAFVVDGNRWLVDPLAPQVPDAGFGPANALVVEGGR